MFLELLFRMAKFLYSTNETLTAKESDKFLLRMDQNSSEAVLVSQAFYIFVN